MEIKPKIIKNNLFKDNRGSLLKIAHSGFFLKSKKKKIKINQINITHTKKRGTIRGMHFQKKSFKELKIVTCLKGKIFDAIIDVRVNKKSYGKIKKFILDKPTKSLVIPEGYAHGFQSLTNDCTILYLHSNFYSKKFEDTINPLKIDLDWPIKQVVISKKDKNGKILKV